MKALALSLLLSSVSYAQDTTPQTPPSPPVQEKGTWDKVKDAGSQAVDYGQEAIGEANATLAQARKSREERRWGILGNYSLFDLWVPNKYGITGLYNETPKQSYELEYLRGSIGFGYFGLDIGSLTEQRLSALIRRYGGRNSFNLIFGIFYGDMRVKLGNKYLDTVAGTSVGNVDVVTLQTLGATFGLGNRWAHKNGLTWGIDWFVINWAVFADAEAPFMNQTNNPERKEDVEDAVKILKRVPAITVLKLQLGYSF